MDRKALIAIALSFVVLFGSNFLFQKLGWIPSPAQQRAANEAARTDSTTGPSPAPGATTLGATRAPASGVTAPLGAPAVPGDANPNGTWLAPAGADSVLTIDQPLYTARVRARGARLLSVVLKNYKDGDSGRATLAADPMVALDLGDTQTPVSLADVPYAWAESLDASGRVARLTLTARDSSGLAIEQTYRFNAQDYRIGLSVAIAGLDQRLDLRRYRVQLRSWPLVTEQNRLEDLNNLAVTAKVGKDNRREMASGLKKGPKPREGAVTWLAVHSKYFLLGLIGQNVQGVASSADLAPGTSPETHDAVVGEMTVPLPSAGRVHQYTLYAGPLDYWHVQQIGMDLEPPHALLFNFFKPFSSALTWLLGFFHRLVGNWGLAIILLSVLAKVVTHPLQAKGMRSMRQMQLMQPEITRLKKKYEKDPAKMNEAMMALYKDNKINPISGCLPMLIQMPFFLALYHVLGYAIGLRQAGFLGWITDLSSPDLLTQIGPLPIRVLPLLMYGSMVLQMKMAPSDPQQKTTMMLMNLVFLFLFYNLPSGLVLYWTVINLMTALQSWLIARGDPQPTAKAA
jgi:YidC/Oxa1 family membrane protein insertase